MKGDTGGDRWGWIDGGWIDGGWIDGGWIDGGWIDGVDNAIFEKDVLICANIEYG